MQATYWRRDCIFAKDLIYQTFNAEQISFLSFVFFQMKDQNSFYCLLHRKKFSIFFIRNVAFWTWNTDVKGLEASHTNTQTLFLVHTKAPNALVRLHNVSFSVAAQSRKASRNHIHTDNNTWLHSPTEVKCVLFLWQNCLLKFPVLKLKKKKVLWMDRKMLYNMFKKISEIQEEKP